MKQRTISMSLCGRLTAIFSALAICIAVGYSLWAGNTHGFKPAAAIVLFVGVSAVLEFFFPTNRSSTSSGEAN